MRYALGVEYNGSRYCGWQYQDHSSSVQAEIEKALSFVADEPVHVTCAGRTDTGVHATGQVIHFDTSANRDERAWVFGGNANLPKDITITWASIVDDEFHARFSAVRRAYRYVICNRDTRPAIYTETVSWDYRPLDADRMQQASQHLLGEHDFSSYRAQECQAKSPVRTLYRLEVSRHGGFIYIDVEANAFLHHMVRNIAGVLIAIGAGEQPVDWTRTVLAYRDRSLGGVTARPGGLYLVHVKYLEKYGFPRPALPSFG
jgi:tRNA pseudouridine38-40 synthase